MQELGAQGDIIKILRLNSDEMCLAHWLLALNHFDHEVESGNLLDFVSHVVRISLCGIHAININGDSKVLNTN